MHGRPAGRPGAPLPHTGLGLTGQLGTAVTDGFLVQLMLCLPGLTPGPRDVVGTVDLVQGLADAVAWFREAGYLK